MSTVPLLVGVQVIVKGWPGLGVASAGMVKGSVCASADWQYKRHSARVTGNIDMENMVTDMARLRTDG